MLCLGEIFVLKIHVYDRDRRKAKQCFRNQTLTDAIQYVPYRRLYVKPADVHVYLIPHDLIKHRSLLG